MAQIDVAIAHARCSYADKGNIRIKNGGADVRGGVKATAGMAFSHQFGHPALDDRTAAGLQHFEFGRINVDPGHMVAHVREACGADTTDIAHPENADRRTHYASFRFS